MWQKYLATSLVIELWHLNVKYYVTHKARIVTFQMSMLICVSVLVSSDKPGNENDK